MSLLLTAFVVLLALAILSLPLILVVYGTVKKTRWGMNFQRVMCPRCGTVQPRARVPKSSKQTLWGGTTCPTCGAELDKWGREIAR